MTKQDFLEIVNGIRVLHDTDRAINEIESLCSEIGLEFFEVCDDITEEDGINNRLQYMVEQKFSWVDIQIFLENIENCHKQWYILNGYGSLEEIGTIDIDCYCDYMIENVNEDIFEKEEA